MAFGCLNLECLKDSKLLKYRCFDLIKVGILSQYFLCTPFKNNLDFSGSGLAFLLYVPTYESEGLGCKMDLMQKIQPFVFSLCPKFQDNSEIRCRRLKIVCIISIKFLCERNFQPSAFVMSKISKSH